jgi:hypothetical protein
MLDGFTAYGSFKKQLSQTHFVGWRRDILGMDSILMTFSVSSMPKPDLKPLITSTPDLIACLGEASLVANGVSNHAVYHSAIHLGSISAP